jgi:hypothetical protein
MDAATWDKPSVFGRFVLTPTHEDRARPISYNQIDRYKWRIPYDTKEV